MSRPQPIRVLVADDSPTARASLTAVLEKDGGIEVIAEAVDGIHAVELARMFRPEVVLMDIEMPGIDGLEATRRIMSEHPTRVIVISGRFEPHQLHVVRRAVQAGALTVVPKPSAAPGAPEYSEQSARLVAIVHALADVKVVRQRGHAADVDASPRRSARTLRWQGLEVAGVAASTGGPAAICSFLQHLPPTLEIPVLVVQHIARGFIDGLAASLAGATSLPLHIAADGERLRGGHVYLAPDHRHLRVRDGKVHLAETPPVGGFRPAANVLFASLAETYGPHAVGVILSGMGHDGVAGARALREAGGLVLAQDDTSLIFGMPRAVATAGLAHLVGPVHELAAQVGRASASPAVVA